MKINNKKILYIVSILIVILVPFIKFGSTYLEYYGIMSNYDNINPSIIFYVSLIPLLYIYISDIIKSKRVDIIDYLSYIFIFISFISCILSGNKYISFFGKSFRHEGFFTILSYILLMLNWKNNKDISIFKRIIKIFIYISVISVIYSLLQMYTDLSFIIRYYDNGYLMSSGIHVNPNFFGSYIVTILSIITCKYLIDKKINIKNLLIIILLFVGLINSKSTGPFLTFIIVFVFMLIYLLYKNKLKIINVLILILSLLFTYISIYFVNVNNYKILFNKKNLDNTSLKVQVEQKDELSKEGIKETVKSGGNGRIEIWKNTLDIVKNNLLLGIGYENFYLKYPNDLSGGVILSFTSKAVKTEKKNTYIVDNAHNVYLHMLTSIGIFGLISYLLILIYVFIYALKTNNNLVIILLFGFISYSIQAIANISVIQVAPIYYLIMGFILSNRTNN